ncbi:FGGY-family carbohydrate kinase [Kangiella sp. TOML190]|uniref:FGGY-family carbohydrate kinase n=1 Tax=Kangiella sp. TOML190 TaxID=2931351 RepID=UPI00203ED724|nr:FGGY-family carbohydrate kinase [Kangiella sp. TOML190]
MTEETILAIDNGTQSLRAIIFDLAGNLIAKSQVPLLEAYFSDQADWSEQHPHFFWDSLCRACNNLWQDPKVDRKAIKAVAVTTMRNTVINLDEQGEPLRPAIIWTDKRKLKDIKPIQGLWKYAFKLARVEDTIHNFQASCQAAWIAHHQPQIWQKTHKYLLLSGYLNFKLTGEFKDSLASQVGYIPFDYKRHQWAQDGDWKWQVAPMDKDLLPDLVKPGEPIGQVHAAASVATGIPKNIPVIAAGADKSSEVLGSGCIQDHQACLSYGTTATINVTSSKYIEPIKFVPPYPSNVADAYTIEYQIYRGYWMVSWFKEQFGQMERDLSQKMGIAAEQLFDEAITLIPPGSEGLMLQPYWSPGVKIPDPEARGAIIGFSDLHTRAHVYRAILEGIAYGLRDGMESIEKRTKQPMQELIVSGGGSQSPVAMQLTADIFNMPAIRPHTYETSALGAAINAAVGIGAFKNYAEAVKAMCRHGETFEPLTANVALYEELYQQGYKKMYRQLKPIYQRFRQLLG